MTNPTTIERLPDESARAYAARVEYVLMGAGRSLEKTRLKLAKSSPGYTRVLKEWSAQYGWADTAREWDDQQARAAVDQASAQYRADLEAHRKASADAGKNLYALANALTRIYADALQQPRQIEGKDGKTYTLHKIMVDTGTLTTIGRALTASLDLTAHSLGVDSILSRLDDSE
jgi:hypothetical protein